MIHGSVFGAVRRLVPCDVGLRHTSRGFVGRWDGVRLRHPTLSREARLSVGFY